MTEVTTSVQRRHTQASPLRAESSPTASPAGSAFTNKRASTVNGLLSSSSFDSTDRSGARSDRSSSREGSTRSGSSIKRLIPGYEKRERRRAREEEEHKAFNDEHNRGRSLPSPAVDITSSGLHGGNRTISSLVTEDAARSLDLAGFTPSSPVSQTRSASNVDRLHVGNLSTEHFPSVVEPSLDSQHNHSSTDVSPFHERQNPISSPSGLAAAATGTSLLPSRGNSISRSKSPARKFRDVFKRGDKSANTSPERIKLDRPPEVLRKTSSEYSGMKDRDRGQKRTLSPLRTLTLPATPSSPVFSLSGLDSHRKPPHTPPRSSVLDPPFTTVTPPTPVNPDHRFAQPLPVADSSPTITLTHRRTQSAAMNPSHHKSKLSHSTPAPLTPTLEEIKTPGEPGNASAPRNVSMGGGGFFSSWVSAASNAASSITNLTGPPRSRAGTHLDEPLKATAGPELVVDNKAVADSVPDHPTLKPDKELAVKTLGTGELDLQALGITGVVRPGQDDRTVSHAGEKVGPDSSVRPQEAVKSADTLSTTSEARTVVDASDLVGSTRAPTSDLGRTLTPTTSLYEGEFDGRRRSNSIRSKIAARRHRASSNVSGQPALAIANPAAPSKPPGSVLAPKLRNKAFHQLFRSIPEDDSLVEDYSCALQRDILLAGRIYISEGHICFSSNILGWVTTVMISFDEIVSIEKEYTALVIPNAIAIQTLHARHTFRSLLSREATYDLIIGIWKVSHPDSFSSFQKTMNGGQKAEAVSISDTTTMHGEGGDHDEEGEESEDQTDLSDSGSDENSLESRGSVGSHTSQQSEQNSLSEQRMASTMNSGPGPAVEASGRTSPPVSTTVTPTPLQQQQQQQQQPPPPQQQTGSGDAVPDFPGPASHGPTDCTDKASHYDKLIKDEVIQAPLGKVYSLLFGPQSGAFMRKFLADGRCTEIAFDDDQKGLGGENKTRFYKYIKPLGGSIGPKQTTCNTTETLEAFDLDRSVSVNCSTASPDVPSGSAFLTKTKYCLSWAAGNATRFHMTMTVEWTGKSWLKGPIEKGALDGQTTYGEEIIKAVKAALGRSRAATSGSKAEAKSGSNNKKKSKRSRREKHEGSEKRPTPTENWGPLEMLRPSLEPILAPIRPVFRQNVLIGVLVVMVLWMWFRGSPGSSSRHRCAVVGTGQTAKYESLWRQEESHLWEWLESRAGGLDGLALGEAGIGSKQQQQQQQVERQKVLRSRDFHRRLQDEGKSIQAAEDAIRATQQRLDMLKESLRRNQEAPTMG